MHILVVDDNPAHMELAAVILTNEGHRVTSVASGIAALKFLSEQDCDLVFMDVQMPEIDGLTTTSLIRQYGRGKVTGQPELQDIELKLAGRLKGRHIRIIALTAHALPQDREHCFAAGMDDYLSKPFTQVELLAKLKTTEATVATTDESENEQGGIAGDKVKPAMPSGAMIRAHLVTTFDLEHTVLDKFLQLTAQSLFNDLRQLEKAVEKGDTEVICSCAHSLKGTMLTLGLNSSVELAKGLEAESQKVAKMGGYAHLTRQLREVVDTLLVSIR